MTNEELIIKKLKELTGKLLTISKKIKALEEKKELDLGKYQTAFTPNEKFLSWYEGSFNDEQETEEEVIEEDEEVIEEESEPENPELTETLEELDQAMNGEPADA